MTKGSSTNFVGRPAGLAYLLIVLCSSAGYITLDKLLTGSSDMVLDHLARYQTQFTLAFVASAIGFATWVVLAVLLYKLMKESGRIQGLLMLFFAVAGVAMNLVALSQLIPFLHLKGSGLDAGAPATFVHSYNRLLLLAQVFSGLWLFPFGWLVLRSRIAPRLLGICLMVGGVFYLLDFATAFEPGLSHMVAYRIASTATGAFGVVVGELGMCLWLLFKGARDPRSAGA